MLKLHPVAHDCANSAILVSGSARSGTTIVGKLIHSFSTVEYVFEPPALIALFPLMGAMPREQWNYLYEAYLYEEFLINAVSGRAINTNRADDSSIFKSKDEWEIASRLDRSWPKSESTRLAASCRAAYKIPNIVAYVPELCCRYPGMSVIMMVRNAVETIHSLMAKHVFTPDHPSAMQPWPFRIVENERIPYWVRLGDEKLWKELSEIDRCAYYYIRMNENLEVSSRQFVLKYSELVKSPLVVSHKLADFLGLSFGKCTDGIIDSIKPSWKVLDTGVIASISDTFRCQVIECSERSE